VSCGHSQEFNVRNTVTELVAARPAKEKWKESCKPLGWSGHVRTIGNAEKPAHRRFI